MIPLNFYKIRTGIDIRPLKQDGNSESELRYEQIIQTISQRAEIEFISNEIYEISESSPFDLGFYDGIENKSIYIMIFGIDKTRSAWTAHLLNQEFGNMKISQKILNLNPNAEQWIGGIKNNISCSAAFFDLRAKRKKRQ